MVFLSFDRWNPAVKGEENASNKRIQKWHDFMFLMEHLLYFASAVIPLILFIKQIGITRSGNKIPSKFSSILEKIT